MWPATQTLPQEIADHIENGGAVCAHNAPFEHAVLTYYYGQAAPVEQMSCSMARALAYGLPAALGEAGDALGLAMVKDKSARALMLAMGKPRKGGAPWHEVDPARLDRLRLYCEQDVRAERDLSKNIPPLSKEERAVSDLDARCNLAGVMLDTPAIKTLMGAAAKEQAKIAAEVAYLTQGSVTNVATQGARLQAWLAGEGEPLPDLKKETVAEALLDPFMAGTPRRVLELRALGAKASLAKLKKMLDVVGPDDRMRGSLQYYGGTGRWAGRLAQPQNLPRPDPGTNVDRVLATIRLDGSLPEILYDKPLRSIASCLRGCFVAKPGHVLLSLDLSQIEARVMAWLAGQDDLLERFEKGIDPYPPAAASVGSTDRQLGKVMVLACQFGMGLNGEKFQATAKDQYGVILTIEEAQTAVFTYRTNNPRICSFWWDLLEAAKTCLGTVPQKGTRGVGRFGALGGRQRVRKVGLWHSGRTLKIEKPNGELLYYHNPSVDQEENYWFDGVDQKTGRWLPQRTYGGKLAENITQSVARDVMAAALVRVEKAYGLVPVMTVHDEAVYEIVDAGHVVRKVQAEFNRRPAWALDLPIASEARTGRRYGK
jgi:DNA polymerase